MLRGGRYRGKWVNAVCFSGRTMDCRLSAGPALPFSAGYKIYDLTLTPAQSRLAAGERLVLTCMATTELNVGIEFNWTHSGHALVSAAAYSADKVVFRIITITHPPSHQTSATHGTPHKTKLWNSLELSNRLVVDNVTVDHTGEFTCTASSGLMEKSAMASLQVFGEWPQSVEVEPQSLLVLHCWPNVDVPMFMLVT